MSDIEAIRQLSFRYARAADRRDYAAFAEVFLEEGSLVLPETTLDGLPAIQAAMAQLEQFTRTQHFVQNVLAEVSGDEASAEVYCLASHIYLKAGAQHKLDWGIRYLDELQRTSEGWRIRRRELIREWVQDLPLLA